MGDRLERNKANAVAFYDLMFNQCRPAEAIEQFVVAASQYGILVDKGQGFWVDNTSFWKDTWFNVSLDEQELAQVLDRYIMRQSIMLNLRSGQFACRTVQG